MDKKLKDSIVKEKAENSSIDNMSDSEDKKAKVIRFLKRYVFIISFLVSFLIMLIIMVLAQVEPFGDKTILIGDSMDQYMPFFSVLKSKLEAGDLALHNFSYSWEVGLGANFLLLFYF